MPVFYRGRELIGYTGLKAHLQDIGGKEPYSTDTVDVFQEGTIFPGLKLYKRASFPTRSTACWCQLTGSKYVVGDVEALVVAVRAGAAALCDVVDRFGLDEVETCVERMYDHGEAVIRSYFEKIPDGRYIAHGMMDNNGVDTDSIPFEVALEVEGSTVRVDYSNSPPMQNGPVNCPIASTVSATAWRSCGSPAAATTSTRATSVRSRSSPVPAPCSIRCGRRRASSNFIPAMQAMEVILRACPRSCRRRCLRPATATSRPPCGGGSTRRRVSPGPRACRIWGAGCLVQERRPELPDCTRWRRRPATFLRGLRIRDPG